jgi:uncharacterized membrane protein
VPLLALLLDSLPWGLRLWPIYGGVVGVTALCAAAALWRRGRLPVAEQYIPPTLGAAGRNPQQRFSRSLLGLGFILVLAVGWLWLVPPSSPRLTEFYMVGAEGVAEAYPRTARVGETLALTIGITNEERHAQSYHVEIWAHDPLSRHPSELVGRAGPFDLVVGEAVRQTVSWQMSRAGDNQEIELLLFSSARAGADPYRKLRFWIDVLAPAQE